MLFQGLNAIYIISIYLSIFPSSILQCLTKHNWFLQQIVEGRDGSLTFRYSNEISFAYRQIDQVKSSFWLFDQNPELLAHQEPFLAQCQEHF